MFSRRQLRHNRIVVTGAAGGIGSALARLLVTREEASVILLDRNAAALAALQAELPVPTSPNGGRGHRVACVDITDAAAIDAFADSVASEPLDGLINNAGVAYGGTFETMSMHDFRKVMEVNLMGAVHLTNRLLPQLIDRRGFIANIASGAGLVAPAGLAAYATSKFALVGFSEALRAELRGRVSVTAICPAFIATDIGKRAMAPSTLTGEAELHFRETVESLLHRSGKDPSDAAETILAAIRRERGTVPMCALTHVIFNAKKLAPALVDLANHLQFRHLVGLGVMR
ncbi:MAG: SDR family oxidoreductase [Candidatus Schekmanbacteria bacterium]|nr:SDR family oxidoreductase [Candidatus Schekmanbacteria bacterium]